MGIICIKGHAASSHGITLDNEAGLECKSILFFHPVLIVQIYHKNNILGGKHCIMPAKKQTYTLFLFLLFVMNSAFQKFVFVLHYLHFVLPHDPPVKAQISQCRMSKGRNPPPYKMLCKH